MSATARQMTDSGDASTLLPAAFTFRREKLEDGGERRELRHRASSCLCRTSQKKKRRMVLVPEGLCMEKTKKFDLQSSFGCCKLQQNIWGTSPVFFNQMQNKTTRRANVSWPLSEENCLQQSRLWKYSYNCDREAADKNILEITGSSALSLQALIPPVLSLSFVPDIRCSAISQIQPLIKCLSLASFVQAAAFLHSLLPSRSCLTLMVKLCCSGTTSASNLVMQQRSC